MKAIVDFNELHSHIKARGLQALYVIHGPEAFLRGEAVRLLKEAALQRKPPAEVSEFDGSELDPVKLFDHLYTASLFAPERMAIVDNAEFVLDKAEKPLSAYAAKPAPRTSLVLVVGDRKRIRKADGADKTDRSEKSAGVHGRSPQVSLKGATHIECRTMRGGELSAWCVARARAQGKQMDFRAVQMLLELAGKNPGELERQIQALAAYVKDRRSITSDDVARLVGGDHARSFWELAQAILDRSPAKALRVLDRLIRDSDRPTWMIFRLGREVRKLISLKECMDSGYSLEEIASRPDINMADWQVRKSIAALKNTSREELIRNLRLLLETDVSCKTGALPERWALERLVLQMSAPLQA